MTSRRTPSRTRAGTRTTASRTRRAAASSSGINPGIIVGIGVAVVAVIVLATMDFGDEGGAQANTNNNQNSQTPAKKEPAKQPAKQPAKKSKPSKSSQEGKTAPTTQAPSIDNADLQRAEDHYRKAQQLFGKAEGKKAAGDNAGFNSLKAEAVSAIEAGFKALEPYNTWLDEADLMDWIVPDDYRQMALRLKRYSKLKNRIQGRSARRFNR